MYPHFLVIGAQKAGTTWLDRNLRTHPQIWLPPEKEIHFFDLPTLLPFTALLFAPARTARCWAKSRLKRDWAKVRAGEQSLGWYLRYYFQVRTGRWYKSLFQPAAGQICGECTPRYAVLSEADVARIRNLMPNSKIIYLLRDPIDRMWSDAAMFQGRRFGGKGLRHADADSVTSFLSHPKNLAHSCYASNLARWEKFYPVDRLFIGYQEEIRENPEELLQRVHEFLGVTPNLPESLVRAREHINSKTYPAPSRDILHSLAANLSAETRSLHGRLASPHTEAWLERNSLLRERNDEAKTK